MIGNRAAVTYQTDAAHWGLIRGVHWVRFESRSAHLRACDEAAGGVEADGGDEACVTLEGSLRATEYVGDHSASACRIGDLHTRAAGGEGVGVT